MEEFTVTELVRTPAPALDAASKNPVKLVRNKSKYGPRKEYVILSKDRYLKIMGYTDKPKVFY